MRNKLALFLILGSLSLTSCFRDTKSIQKDEENLPADNQSSNEHNNKEEIDPRGFDPNFDYTGSNATDFRIMASRYNANPEFYPEPSPRDGTYIKAIWDFGIITFSFKGMGIVAYHVGDRIIEVHKFENHKMTISEARSYGFFGEKQEKYEEGHVYYVNGGKSSLTKKYEKTLDSSLRPPSFAGDFDHLTEFRKFVDFFKSYGIPTAMLVYFDGLVDDYINDMEGLGYCGLAVNYASAIPIFSDDLSEIVGSTVMAYRYGSLKHTFTYLKEEGFGTIKTAREMISQINDPNVEVIQNPSFYVGDTSRLPKGNWKIILGDGKKYN